MFDENKIKELYPDAVGMMYEPMLIHGSTDDSLQRACASGEYFGQLKKDGAFYQFVKGAEGGKYLFGRTISKKTSLLTEKLENVPHIAEALDCLPNGTILIGEIYYPGKSSKNTVEIMGCLPEKALQRQQGSYGYIHYYIHDIIYYDGINLVSSKTNNELRYKILQKIFYLHNLDKYNFLELAEVWTDNLYERVGEALAAGEEGMVIKKKDGIYEPSKRPMSNLKAKKVDFADVIITGFETPTKEYYGKEIQNWEYWIDPESMEIYIGNHYQDSLEHPEKFMAVTKPFYNAWMNARIKIGAYDNDGNIVEIGVIHSGISDEMKEDMTLHEEKYLNHVCKIQMMEKDSKAKTIRHGFFRGLRDDKDAKDCLIDTIF